MANERLRDALLRTGITTTVLADTLGVNPKTAERWVTTDRPPYPRHRHAITRLVQESESYLWPNAIAPERTTQISESEVIHLYPRRSTVPGELWSRLLDQATEQISILAYAGLFFPEREPKLAKMLAAKAANGCGVEILLGDPESHAVALRGSEEDVGDAMAAKIRNVLPFYRRLEGVEGVGIRYHETALYNSIYRFDDEMLVNTHAYGSTAAFNPVLHLRRLPNGELFEFYAETFGRVWDTGRSIWSATGEHGG